MHPKKSKKKVNHKEISAAQKRTVNQLNKIDIEELDVPPSQEFGHGIAAIKNFS